MKTIFSLMAALILSTAHADVTACGDHYTESKRQDLRWVKLANLNVKVTGTIPASEKAKIESESVLCVGLNDYSEVKEAVYRDNRNYSRVLDPDTLLSYDGAGVFSRDDIQIPPFAGIDIKSAIRDGDLVKLVGEKVPRSKDIKLDVNFVSGLTKLSFSRGEKVIQLFADHQRDGSYEVYFKSKIKVPGRFYGHSWEDKTINFDTIDLHLNFGPLPTISRIVLKKNGSQVSSLKSNHLPTPSDL